MNLMKISTYNFFKGVCINNIIPSSEEINNEGYSKLNMLINSENLNVVRIILVITAIVTFILYRYWRKNMKFNKSYIYVAFMLSICTIAVAMMSMVGSKDKSSDLVIGSSMNIGNALEAPRNTKWDVEMKVEYIEHIKTAGFQAVRIPVRFSDYLNEDGLLDEEFMAKIDYFTNYALDSGLKVILDMHHFEELMNEPENYKDKFLELWAQLGERYKDYSENLIFGLLNEPKINLKSDMWNEYLAEGVKIIRINNETRKIIIGADNYNSISGLENLKLPKDNNLILDFHYYEPNDFAFQGNEYHEGFEDLYDIEWEGTEEEVEKIAEDFSKVRKWADKYNIPVYLGEFGINKNAPRESRLRWIQQVREIAEKNNFSWGYWEMASEFGIYDSEQHIWDEEALKALLPNR